MTQSTPPRTGKTTQRTSPTGSGPGALASAQGEEGGVVAAEVSPQGSVGVMEREREGEEMASRWSQAERNKGGEEPTGPGAPEQLRVAPFLVSPAQNKLLFRAFSLPCSHSVFLLPSLSPGLPRTPMGNTCSRTSVLTLRPPEEESCEGGTS